MPSGGAASAPPAPLNAIAAAARRSARPGCRILPNPTCALDAYRHPAVADRVASRSSVHPAYVRGGSPCGWPLFTLFPFAWFWGEGGAGWGKVLGESGSRFGHRPTIRVTCLVFLIRQANDRILIVPVAVPRG